jgi:hypothetical protein
LVWNEELLFLHPQKTAGMAVSEALWNTLSTPVFSSVPLGHWDRILRPGVAQVLGLRHENIFEAAVILKPYGRALADFKAILVVMRNPYDMEVSRYYHLRKPEAFETDEERRLAQSLSFEDFVLQSKFRCPHPDDPQLEFREAIKNYYAFGATFLENLRILRYENLEEELNNELRAIGYGPVTLPRINVSDERQERDFRQVVKSAAVEDAIYKKYRWIFEHGFYTRLSLSQPAN